jgi:hypothetical protein
MFMMRCFSRDSSPKVSLVIYFPFAMFEVYKSFIVKNRPTRVRINNLRPKQGYTDVKSCFES